MANLNTKCLEEYTFNIPEKNGADKPEADKTKTRAVTVLLSDTNYIRFHQTPNKVDLYWAQQRTGEPIDNFNEWLDKQK